MTCTDRVGPYLFQLGGVIQTSTMFLSTDLARAARFAEDEPGHDDWTFALRLEALGARFEMVTEALTYYRDDDRPDRRSPRRTRISLDWFERYRDLLGESAYLAGRAAFGSRMRNDAPVASLKMIITALWRGAVPPWRSAYYLGAWAFPEVRRVGVYIKQIWSRPGRRAGAGLAPRGLRPLLPLDAGDASVSGQRTWRGDRCSQSGVMASSQLMPNGPRNGAEAMTESCGQAQKVKEGYGVDG